jgi:VanZ family protein
MARLNSPVRGTPPPASRLSSVRAWRRLLSDYGPPLLMMVLIFAASTDVGSPEHSGRIVERILTWLGLAQRLTPGEFGLVHHYVRKLGHVTEYALLATLLHRAAARERARWTVRLVAGVIAVTALYAATDEFHQRFVPTRGPSVADVLLDTAGAMLGLGLKWLREHRWSRRSSG